MDVGGSESNDRCLWKRRKKETWIQRRSRTRMEAELGGMRPQVQGCLEPQEAGRDRKGCPPLEPLQGMWPHLIWISLALPHLDLRFWSPDLGEDAFLLPEPTSRWRFVRAVRVT